MVWIHGGGYTFGSAETMYYGPEFLLTKDIVLVTVNYRLGIFGKYMLTKFEFSTQYTTLLL